MRCDRQAVRASLATACLLLAACGGGEERSDDPGQTTIVAGGATTGAVDETTTTITEAIEPDQMSADETANGSTVGDVTIQTGEGPGWELVSVEPGFGHPHEVAFMASERALDRGSDARWFGTRPVPDFETEAVIVLAPSVSGSCPALIFHGLEITDRRIFGVFEDGPPPEGATVCTGDANPVAFVFLVALESLPEIFDLSVGELVVCGGCERAEIAVDLGDLATLERTLWGAGTLNVVIDGSPPAAGTAHVFRWAPDAALLLRADEFTSLPRWIQSFGSDETRTIEGFVVDCGIGQCPEECEGPSCAALQPLGDVCAYEHRPESFRDETLTITWDGEDCAITALSTTD